MSAALGLELSTLEQLLLIAVGALATSIGVLFWHHAREQRRNVSGWEKRDTLNIEAHKKVADALTELKVTIAVILDRLPRGSK